MEDYLNAANELVKTHGAARNIVLATDDEGVIEKLEAGAYDSWNYTYYYHTCVPLIRA